MLLKELNDDGGSWTDPDLHTLGEKMWRYRVGIILWFFFLNPFAAGLPVQRKWEGNGIFHLEALREMSFFFVCLNFDSHAFSYEGNQKSRRMDWGRDL